MPADPERPNLKTYCRKQAWHFPNIGLVMWCADQSPLYPLSERGRLSK
jgi:hypothetical protein